VGQAVAGGHRIAPRSATQATARIAKAAKAISAIATVGRIGWVFMSFSLSEH
jgi:hypothetical protein